MIHLTCSPPGQPRTELRLGVARGEVREASSGPGVFVLADEKVLELFEDLATDLAGAPSTLTLAAGEDAKSFPVLQKLLRAMAACGLQRDGRLVVLGGGSIGDLGGLAASLFLRGVRHLQVPTTLLSMLDSSVGGKTAINLPEGKNLVGSFWPAERVLIHPDFLTTLPQEEFCSGLGEALKVAIGLSAELFALLEEKRAAVPQRDPILLTEIIHLALAAKIAIVEEDPLEQSGARHLLNLGHTLGHALEAASGYTLAHGRAVARGIHFALHLARARGALAGRDAARCKALLTHHGFPPPSLPPRAELLPFLARDKKARGKVLQFVLPTGIGESRCEAMSLEEIQSYLPADGGR